MKIKKKQTIAQLEKELSKLEKDTKREDKIADLKLKIKALKYRKLNRGIKAGKEVAAGIWDVTKKVGKGFMAVGDKLAAEQEEMAKKRAEQEKLNKKNKKKPKIVKMGDTEYEMGDIW